MKKLMNKKIVIIFICCVCVVSLFFFINHILNKTLSDDKLTKDGRNDMIIKEFDDVETFAREVHSDEELKKIYEESEDNINILDDFEIKKDKITFVNFWATWCGPCVGEMGDLQDLYDEMKDNKNVDMIFVNLGDKKEEVEAFLKYYNYTMPMYCDIEGKLGEKYEIYAIPQTFIFDKTGEIVENIIGANEKNVYKNAINKILEK